MWRRRVGVAAMLLIGAVVGGAQSPTRATAAEKGTPPVKPAAGAPSATEPLWAKSCAKDAAGAEVCYAEQFAIAAPQNIMMLHVQVGYIGPEGRPRLVLATPTGVALPAGVTLTLDADKPLVLPFDTCQSGGCLAIADLDQEVLKRLMSGKIMAVRYVNGDRTPIDIPVQLTGLAQILETVTPAKAR